MRPVFQTACVAVMAAPAAAHADTLQDALITAYYNNPTLEAARANARSVDEGFAQARSSYLPTVNLNSAIGVQDTTLTFTGDDADQPAFTNPGLRKPQTNNVQATQSIWTAGRRGARVDQANANIEAAEEALRQTEQQVLLSVVTAFVDVRRDEEALRIREVNVDLLKRRLDEAEQRFEVGDVTRTDVAQARARLASAEADTAAARATLAASRATYRQVVGVSPGTLEAAPSAPPTPPNIEEALAASETYNPRYLQSLAAIAAAEAEIRVQRSNLLPQISVDGSYARNFNTSADNLRTDTAQATARLSVPLFDAGLLRSQLRQSKIDAQRARYQSEETRRAVIAEVAAAWSRLQASERVIDSSRQQREAAALALEGVEQEQRVGQRTTLDVLDAQQELLNSELAVVNAERDAYVNAHALLAAVGVLDVAAFNLDVREYDADLYQRRIAWALFQHDPVGPEFRQPMRAGESNPNR